jgi:phosphatidate cytidylyltransferase
MNPLLLRVLTALVLIPIAVGAVVLGGWWFALVVVVASCLAQWELYGLAERAGHRPMKELGLAAGALVVLIPAWSGALPLAALAVLGLLACELFRRNEAPLAAVAVGILGVVYPAALVAWFVHLRLAAAPVIGEAGASWLLLTIFISVWAADTAAYFTGRSFGRRPLFERVSPKKTIEGAVGGVVGAILVVILLQIAFLPFITVLDAVVLGLIGGIVGPVGDLVESLFKRSVDAKDSGRLLPGHGGMLDRIDAMIFVAPVAVIYLQYVARVF